MRQRSYLYGQIGWSVTVYIFKPHLHKFPVYSGRSQGTKFSTAVARGILIIQLYYCSIRIHVPGIRIPPRYGRTKFSVLEYKLEY